MMAKPKHGRCDNNAFSGPVSPPDHHRIPRSHTHRFPSPALLSALALIATTSPTVAGSPLPLPTSPPSFLCPFIERDTLPPPPDSPSTSSLPPRSTLQPSQCAVVADRYIQDTDNVWHKASTWTLFGSTCYPSLVPSTSAEPSTSQLPAPSALSMVEFDTSVLPAGWGGITSLRSNTESTTILALAIVLAGSICVFVIGCVIWRRRKKKARDVERKLARERSAHDDDSQEDARERDARGKMRLWARASARWKSNIRQSARRRRRRPPASSHRAPSPSFFDSPQLSVFTPPAPSPRPSIASEEPDSSALEAIPLSPPHDPLRFASPPTYGASCSRPPTSSSTHLPVRPHSAQRSSRSSFMEDEPLPYTPPSDGHVATDDKSQLAHIQQLASFPPVVETTSSGTLRSTSAPEWHEVEDELEDFDIDLSQAPTFCSLPPSFPPLPLKTDMTLPFAHSLRYGDGDNISVSLPAPGPSLGPSPSAPPIDDLGLEPSAPSLEGEDDDWDGASSYAPEPPTPADLDSIPSCAIEPSMSISSQSRSCILESAARDGTLPRYHP